MASDVETIIRYDGPALVDHDMDVEALAPALLALGSLIQSANHKFNGDKSAVRVVVNADLKQQCFQIKIKMVQDLLEAARGFLGGDVATIKDICEWIGIVGSGGGLLKLLLSLGKRQQDATILNATANNDATVLQIGHVENLNLVLPDNTPKQVRELLADSAIVAKAKEVLKPVTAPGYETISFVDPKLGQKTFEATKEEVNSALAYTPPEPVSEPGEEEHNEIHARVMVKTQRNEGKAQWELKWAARAEWASIDHTDWLERFQSGQVPHTIPFYLDVRMDMITSRTNPDAPARFHVLQVLNVVPSEGGTQGGLFDGDAPRSA